MNYIKQVEALVSYFKKGEKAPSEFKTGLELEHFIVWKDSLKSVPYTGKEGLENLFEELECIGWEAEREDGHILKLKAGKKSITLEPGSQLEFDISPKKCLGEIESVYLSFLEDLVPLLEKRNQMILALAYHPESSINELSLLPKKRYYYMYNYFKRTGALAHNMMKGTASIQVCIDYSCEEDFAIKCRSAAFLAPFIYCVFDNTPFFEGKVCTSNCTRYRIWNNCDPDRCGLPHNIFTDSFSYESYAEYILSKAPILIMKNNRMVYTGNSPMSEVFDPETFSDSEIDYMLSMYFFDIRLRTYIELRMGDALPYPYNIAYAALWKGLMYDEKNLNTLYSMAKNYDENDMQKLNGQIVEKGIHAVMDGKTVIEHFKDIMGIAVNGLDCCEKAYLSPIEDMLKQELIPRKITLDKLGKGKHKALEWCFLNGINNLKRCDKLECC
ncbi:MAG: glutamate--cysteine ligase [Acetivibrionales bacterium]|jgi:glutamate--cysteine ligase